MNESDVVFKLMHPGNVGFCSMTSLTTSLASSKSWTAALRSRHVQPQNIMPGHRKDPNEAFRCQVGNIDPVKQIFYRRKLPYPGNMSYNCWKNRIRSHVLNAANVKAYLTQYPNVLEEHVLESVPKETVEKWLEIKESETPKTRNKLRCQNCRHHVKFTDMPISTLSNEIAESAEDQNIRQRLYEITNELACCLNADYATLYTLNADEKELYIYEGDEVFKPYGEVGPNMTVAAHVAYEKRSLLIPDLTIDVRFPKGVGQSVSDVHSVIAVPVILPSLAKVGVIELKRITESESFSLRDLQAINAITSWVTACIEKIKTNKTLSVQKQINNFLLEKTKVIFDNIEDIDQLIGNILLFTKDCVNADRCALFLVDEEKHELYAANFYEGVNAEGKPVFRKQSQIRFDKNKGVAGYVATTGQTLNIDDAYSDSRFNRDVDKTTGYKTRNILCMPIVDRGKIIGVVQLVNSLSGDRFTKTDEETFKTFSVYCALALHYSVIYNFMKLQQAKYKVAMEVLDFHIRCNEKDVQTLNANLFLAPEIIPPNFTDYNFCCYSYNDILPQLFIKMIISRFGTHTFDMEKLCRFVLTVRKNYRPLSYHNWEHGFHVAHTIWCIIQSHLDIFTDLDVMALLISALCHDVDHRGYNNEFFKKLNLPLGALYSTSVMEQHHYKQTITILHSEGLDIFNFLSAEKHKFILHEIREHIIATDLALFFERQKRMAAQLKKGEFDLNVPAMKRDLTSLMMTGADLSSTSKSWEDHMVTVNMLYEEFYAQGDIEKKHGYNPIPLMDRSRQDEIPKQQMGFINFIAMPLYTTLVKILPNAQPLLDGLCQNKEKWQLREQEVAASK
ncbi:hypothetical protein CHS0354_018625 [Potamilus streckersoni]|uniref:Phosphodiesterase n=1 Tax=Potamilus streckersoni TaxID=2493646 RepID=A0AAE0SKF8_9BIVA|nr:hypothetical protein CHS0354_018625 [Potamilus streckersoni]